MEMKIKQISYLEKLMQNRDNNFEEVSGVKAVAGARVCYQIAASFEGNVFTKVEIESELKDYVRVFVVKDVYVDLPYTYNEAKDDEYYLTKEPAMMPDVLVPLEEQNGFISSINGKVVLFVKVDLPKDVKAGKYDVKVNFSAASKALKSPYTIFESAVFNIDVVDAALPEEKVIYTRWFYADCIAKYHNVEVYSEKHWELIDKYIAAATESGMNMLLVPTHTPPLDTEIDTERLPVQLVDIEKKNDKYYFSFDKLERFVDIATKNGIKYFEIAHMFSQWGATCAPNIYVKENGELKHLFGWHVSSESEEYEAFLKEYIPALCREFEKLGIAERVYFHISDEPSDAHIENYKKASELIKRSGSCKTMDALSHYEFYEKGLVDCPVTSISVTKAFYDKGVDNLWTYYCCGPQAIYPNSFIAMPSYRVEILGFMMYKWDIKGFLHWGLNFYNSCRSRYAVNPHMNTSVDSAYPSGDAFILYPSFDGAYGSIRGELTYQAIEDTRLCLLLESFIGRDEVVKLIDETLGMELTFSSYPKGNEYILKLRKALTEKIEEVK